jgi:hypothetical protein
MSHGREAAHVDADLGDNDLSTQLIHAGKRARQSHGLAKRVEVAVHLLVEFEDGVERVDLAQVQT